MALAKATTASCGAKASACAHLAKLAAKTKKKGGFGTAEGVCLPFGCMEAVIQVCVPFASDLNDILYALAYYSQISF